MERQVLEKMIMEDNQGLLDIEAKANWMIYGRINGQRGGAFFGFDDQDIPVFGGGNLMRAPMWWNTTFNKVNEVCDKIKAIYPNCEAYPDQRN